MRGLTTLFKLMVGFITCGTMRHREASVNNFVKKVF